MESDRREVKRQPPASVTPPPADADADEVIGRALRLLYLLPAPTLTQRERNRLAGCLVGDSWNLVHSVANALTTYGPELTDVQEDPADLLALQDRADRLMDLRGHLDALLRRAEEAHLRAQSQAVRRAQTVLQRMDRGATLLPDGCYEQRLRRAIVARAARFDDRIILSRRPEYK